MLLWTFLECSTLTLSLTPSLALPRHEINKFNERKLFVDLTANFHIIKKASTVFLWTPRQATNSSSSQFYFTLQWWKKFKRDENSFSRPFWRIHAQREFTVHSIEMSSLTCSSSVITPREDLSQWGKLYEKSFSSHKICFLLRFICCLTKFSTS